MMEKLIRDFMLHKDSKLWMVRYNFNKVHEGRQSLQKFGIVHKLRVDRSAHVHVYFLFLLV